MQNAHIVMAILAAWRLTEIVALDAIFNKPRTWWMNRFRDTEYASFIGCGRCLSVWASIVAAIVFYYIPFLNWPLGMSMSFILYTTYSVHWNTRIQRKITVMPDIGRVDFGAYGPKEGPKILAHAFAPNQSAEYGAVNGKN